MESIRDRAYSTVLGPIEGSLMCQLYVAADFLPGEYVARAVSQRLLYCQKEIGTRIVQSLVVLRCPTSLYMCDTVSNLSVVVQSRFCCDLVTDRLVLSLGLTVLGALPTADCHYSVLLQL
jgi:hypothetical protein